MSEFRFIIPRVQGDDNCFKIFAEASLKKIGAQALNVFDKDPNVKESIFKKYNAGIQALFQSNVLNDDDIIVFMHNDVGILDNFFRDKIEMIFREKTDIGLIGIAGSVELTERGGWWMNEPAKLRGHLIQGKNAGSPVGEGFHLVKGPVGFFNDVVAIDGCLLITNGRMLKEGLKFDDVTFENYMDFYDIDLSFSVLEKGYKIAVADILIYHQSSGMGSLQEPWSKAKEILFKKWNDKGYKLPFTQDQFKLKEVVNQIVEIEI